MYPFTPKQKKHLSKHLPSSSPFLKLFYRLVDVLNVLQVPKHASAVYVLPAFGAQIGMHLFSYMDVKFFVYLAEYIGTIMKISGGCVLSL